MTATQGLGTGASLLTICHAFPPTQSDSEETCLLARNHRVPPPPQFHTKKQESNDRCSLKALGWGEVGGQSLDGSHKSMPASRGAAGAGAEQPAWTQEVNGKRPWGSTGILEP